MIELKKKTYEYGLVVGTRRERNYWKGKIKEEIEKLENKIKKYEEDKHLGTANEFERYENIADNFAVRVLQKILKEE